MNMKKLFLVALMLPIITFTACSSDDDENEAPSEDELLSYTSWSYSDNDGISNHEQREYEDYENRHQIDNVLEICPSLEYTEGETATTEQKDTIDLCDRMGHDGHTSLTLNFQKDDCVLDEERHNYIQIVESRVEETTYTFKEGTYIGTLYGTNHVAITVYNYGIYQSTTNGDVLILPLDGNCNYTVTVRDYDSQVKDNTLSEETANLSFTRNGNNIRMYNDDMSISGTISSNGSELSITKDGTSYTLTK